MTFEPRQQVSIHGRALALNTTGALMVQDRGSTKYAAVVRSTADVVQDSTGMLFAQLGLNPQSAVASSVGSTLTNYGFQSISSASATSITGHQIGTPVTGVFKTIGLDTSGSEIHFGGTSTAMVFHPAIAGAGSSFSATSVPPLAGGVITLMGFASSEWMIVSASPKLTITIG